MVTRTFVNRGGHWSALSPSTCDPQSCVANCAQVLAKDTQGHSRLQDHVVLWGRANPRSTELVLLTGAFPEGGPGWRPARQLPLASLPATWGEVATTPAPHNRVWRRSGHGWEGAAGLKTERGG